MPQHKAGKGTRPTSDRVREALFNVLTSRVDVAGASVLDLYAGSGALGLEALSRGARTATFVESDHRAASVIVANIASLGVVGASVHGGSVASVLAAGTDTPVDLVLADPPYRVAEAEVSQMLSALVEGGWVATGAVVIVERPAASRVLSWPAGWTAWPDRRYGDTRLEMAESR